MCEQTEINYLDGEVVWVKLGSCWWPGEVVGPEKLPPDLLPSFRKPPIAVVKFFQEDTYEYVKNFNSIYKYNCSCKNEFIKKGLYLCKTKPGQMNKFPDDVIHAETVIGGDTDILTREEFQETKKESYAGLFGDTAKRTPSSSKKGKSVKRRPSESPEVFKPARKFMKEKADYKVHILVQGSKTPNSEPAAPSENSDATPQTPSTSTIETEQNEDTPKKEEEITTVQKPTSTFSTPVASSSGIYSCHACSFSTSRLNVLILHNKTHSVSFIPYTPSPVRKKLTSKASTKSSPNSSKTPKVRRPKKENTEKVPKKPSVKKRVADEKGPGENNAKKTKTDEEIKSSLLADWDDGDEELLDESSNAAMVGSPEVPVAAGSPAVPTPAELLLADSSTCEKPESSSDSKYEFCEDEDWPEETDAGRKIPRVMNPKRKEETKSLSLDEDEVAREVAELLNKTAVPDLPAAPEPLKVEENFPEPSIVKSPDKDDESSYDQRSTEKQTVEVPPTKAIFKTKTFFRSRHSRSQDAIGKYVAEQLNAVERMDISESDINGSEVASSPEPSESSVEHVKVARLAPKIQLKKMKAEAAQLREREKLNEYLDNVQDFGQFGDDSNTPSTNSDSADVERGQDNEIEVKEAQVSQDVLYPTQEIKPVNRDDPEPTKLNKANNCEDLNVQGDAELMLQIQEDNVLVDNKPADVTCDIIVEEQPDSATDMENIKQVDITTPETEPPSEMQPEIQPGVSDLINENQNATMEYPETNIETTFKPPVEPYMNETTASAVDALLSVSREADRVTRIISNDLPEDLFEDDNKDAIVTAFNGLNEYVQADSGTKDQEPEKMDDKELKLDVAETIDDSFRSAEETTLSKMDTEQVVGEVCLPEDSIMPTHEQNEVVSEETNNMGNIPSESDLQIAETLINLPAAAIQNKVGEHNEILSLSIPLGNEMLLEDAVHTSENMIVDEEISNELNNKTSTKKVEPRGESLLISNNEAISTRFETEQEKSENLNAAQSLVQMSETIDHKIGITESSVGNTKDIPEIPLNASSFNIKHNNGVDSISMLDQNISQLSSDNINEVPNNKIAKFDPSTSKLLKILEEPCTPKLISKSTPTKQLIVSGKEKILNFDVAKSTFKGKAQSPKQKIIIRRAGPNKNIVSNISEVSGPADKIILSRTNNPAQDGSAVQTFTIQTSPDTPSDANTIIIQQKIRKITKPPAKLHKLKPQTSLISATNEAKVVNEIPSDEAIYDINSMPIVLSEELLTPESIEKMPIVMTDGNIITQTTNPPKLVKTRQTVVENEKVTNASPSKPEVKTLLMNPSGEVNKVTPNILSKSSKLRGAKPMLIIDKTTGKQKIVMTKAEPTVKEPKSVSAPTLIQPVAQNSNKSEKFIILSTPNSPRPARTQKILIDPQTGKAHVLLSKGPEAQNPAENKPVSAKLVPSSSDASAPGNTVMIITNAQGAQSRIVLTPEHEKILFPNKQQSNVSQIKTIAHRLTTNSGVPPKTSIAAMKTQILPSGKTQTIVAAKTHVVASSKTQVVTSTKSQMVAAAKTQALGIGKLQTIVSAKPQIGSTKSHAVTSVKTPALAPAKSTTRIVPKQKSAIITSKGQLIVGGRVATTAQNIAPMPEMRTVPKRIVASEPKKLVQTIQKASSEPLIFLQQKSGAVMQLTAAQFEHLQRTGQIVQKTTTIPENKIAIQKPLTLTPIESPAPPVQKQRVRKTFMESPAPMKKMKQEIAIAPAPVPISPVPTLSPLSNTGQTSLVPAVSNTVSITTTTNYPDLENFEELLPSTAIVRQPEPVIIQPEPVAPPPPAPLSDGQLLAVPGEHFGGPPGSFYLCFEDNGTLTPIDNGPLVLENNQLVPMTVDPLPVLAAQPERRDILEAALANSDVFQADTPRDEAPDFRDLNANVSVHCRVSETSSILNQPIMTPVEVPSKADSEPAVPAGLDAGLAVIGLTPHTVPTSLELPITVTDPRIAPKTTDPLSNNNYGARLLPSPNTEMSFVTEEMHVPMGGPISMPILTDDESVGKSMPILTDELGERTVSSVESTLGSPSSLEVREEEGGWSRRLLTPVSDTSEASAEIPLQPSLQLSLSHHHS